MMRSSKSYPVIANDLHSPGLRVGVENTAPRRPAPAQGPQLQRKPTPIGPSV